MAGRESNPETLKAKAQELLKRAKTKENPASNHQKSLHFLDNKIFMARYFITNFSDPEKKTPNLNKR